MAAPHFDSLKDKWNDAFYPSLVSWIPIGELLEHELFFDVQFNPEACEGEEQSAKTGAVAQSDSGSEIHHEQTGINRMTDPAIRAVLD